MENESAANQSGEATPIFTAYRRGYDPDQVDRFVADQRRRLDETALRASEAERKLAAAVGQLRELHRRVAVLESEEHTAQPPAIDAIGERIQRILQEAWDGAFAMRQSAENDANELRERARSEAEGIIAAARHKAVSLGEELERRRNGFLQRIEEERSKAVTQMTFLSGQRKLALDELVRVRTRIDATVEEFSDTKAPKPRSEQVTTSAPSRTSMPTEEDEDSFDLERRTEAAAAIIRPMERPRIAREAAPLNTADLPRTMPVHRLPEPAPEMEHDASELVRSHRVLRGSAERSATVRELHLERRRERPALFDFEEAEPHGEN